MKEKVLLLAFATLLVSNTYAQIENTNQETTKQQIEGDINGDGVVDDKDINALDKLYNKGLSTIKKNMDMTPKKGYKGFVDLGTALGLDKYDDQIGVDAIVVNGYQFNPYVFAGAGVGYLCFMGSDKGSTDFNYGIPVFADVRVTPLKTKVTPLIELRAGAVFGDFSGLYLQPSVGIRIGLSSKMGLTLKLAYQSLHYDKGNEFKHNYDGWGKYTTSATVGTVTVTGSTDIYQNWTVIEDRGKTWQSVWFQIGFDW